MSRNLTKGKLNLLVDIGSHSVGGALVITGEKPEIVFLKRIRLPWSRIKDTEKIQETILKTLEDVLGIILKEGATALHLDEHKLIDKKIENVLCLVSSPWSVSETNVITKENPKSIEINSRSLDEILDEYEKAKSKEENSDYRLIEKKITEIKLNGYLTENFLNKQANKIEISTFEGRIIEDFAHKMESVIEHSLNSKPIFHTHTLASLLVIQDVFPKISDKITVEITGSRTNITIMEESLIKEITSFPKGTNSLLGRVSEEYGVTADIAMSFLKIYEEKRSEENFRNKIRRIVEEEKNLWISDLEKAIGNLKITNTSKILLTVDPNFKPFFEEFLKTQFADKRDMVMFTGTKALGQFCNSKQNEFDPFIFLGAIFLNKIYPSY